MSQVGLITGLLSVAVLIHQSMIDANTPWKNLEFVAFDTETSGAYPLGSEVVEFGAVKWKNGQIIDTYQTLLRPKEPMSAFIIGIHGITNEMVEDAPLMKEKVAEIRKFFDGAILMAHHAPFDMGFMQVEFQKFKLTSPEEPAICTSLLSRKVIPESTNHKLQTLIGFLNIERGTAHRAYDDARACLEVGLECMRRVGPDATLAQVYEKVGKKLVWDDYSLRNSGSVTMDKMIEAIEEHLSVDIVYDGGSTQIAMKGMAQTRRITPIGIVRNPDGDYIMAKCHRDAANKRFYIGKIKDAEVVY